MIPLSQTLTAALAAPVRHPLVAVIADPLGAPRELSADLLTWSCERRRDARAGSATMSLANPGGRYADLLPGTRIRIQRGLRTAAGVETVPIFTGEVVAAEADHAPGGRETLTLRLLDRAGRALRREITSPLYEEMQATAIVAALFTDFGALTPSEISLAPVECVIPRVQYVGESLMDAGQQVMQAARHRLFFDAAGTLRSAPLRPVAPVAWTLDNPAHLLALRDTRQPPAATRCVVAGAMQGALREVGGEVMWEEVTGSNYDYGVTVDVPFSPAGAVYEEIRLEILTPLADYEQVTLYAVRPDGITLKIISPAGRAITVRCHGRQVFYSTPTAIGVAEDLALLVPWGERRLEIDNGAIADDATAAALADDLLTLARYGRRVLTLTLLAHPGLEPGDRLTFTHPHTAEPLTLFADSVTHRGTPGREDVTIVEALVEG